MVNAGQATCPSNSPEEIVAAISTTVDGSAGGNRPKRSVTVKNPSAQGIYLGGDDTVDHLTGFLLAQNESVSLQLLVGDSIWGVGATGSPVAHWIESAA